MARTFTRISADAFSKFAIDCGLLLNKFDTTGATAVQDADIICATTGDITATCVPTYSDMGQDVNNCPAGLLELMNLDSWETTLGFTALDMTEDTLVMALGAATKTNGKVTPSTVVSPEMAKDYWLVADLVGGGFACVHLMNGLSSDGLNLSLTKNGKGKLSVKLHGHVKSNAQDVVPMEFFISD